MIEYKLLGIVLNSPELLDDLLQYDDLFDNTHCKRLIEIVQGIKIKHSNLNRDLIEDTIKTGNLFNQQTFYEIYDSCCNDELYKPYLSKVLTKSLIKRVKNYAVELNETDKNYVDIQLDVQKLIESVKHIEDKKAEDTKAGCRKLLEKLSNNYVPKKIISCIDFIDDNQRGYDPTDYIIIGAAESVGKTSFCIDKIAKQIQQGLRIAFFSCEMRKEKIEMLLACHYSGVDSNLVDNNIMNKLQSDQYVKGVEKLYDKPLFIEDTSRDWEEIKRRIKYLKNTENVDIVYIDYLQYLRVRKFRNMYERLEEISTSIKDTAKKLEIPIVCVASLNRTGKQDEEPKNFHIKGNGDIEYDADIICLLKTESKAVNGDFNKRIIKAIISKNRNGKLGIKKYLFYPACRRYESTTLYDRGDE